ncbi:MAG: hypothetical protein BRC29_03270 [Nanohaloarchaea archaeon SW_7_43_1]|nr:MAG: hypothetical protein BRC29_03270 [Nanohaloarchaea archaeon SW_7_43_1]
MDKVKIYQIGLDDFGRHGFDKLVELSREFEKIELCGVCDKDFERLESAEKFAEINDIEIETFQRTEEMYSNAEQNSGTGTELMVYDAGPATDHSENIYKSMQHNFFHLAEKPPSMNRGEHIREKRLSEKGNAMWKVDFIERENPTVKKAMELVQDKNIEKIETFRESSVGIEKAIDNAARLGVKGGDILDKMINEIYTLDVLEKAGNSIDLELKDVECRYFHPRTTDGERFTGVYSGHTDRINSETSTGMTQALFKADDTELKLHSSWMGLSEEAMFASQSLEEKTGHRFFKRNFSEMNGKAYVNEEARFFIIRGEKDLAGDMMSGSLFNLDTGEEIETENYLHDQLYRVLEKAVFHASGKDVEIISEKEIDIFMNAIFDIKDTIRYDRDYYSELEKAQEKIRSLIVEDRKVIEAEESEKIAG